MVKKLSRGVSSGIPDKQFWGILRQCAGNITECRDEILKQTGIQMSRQAVHQRATRQMEQLNDIRDEAVDAAEAGLMTLMKSKNQTIKIKAIELFLKAYGKKRGYGNTHQIEFNVNLPEFTGFGFLPKKHTIEIDADDQDEPKQID